MSAGLDTLISFKGLLVALSVGLRSNVVEIAVPAAEMADRRRHVAFRSEQDPLA